jgi:hypothetical protein
MVHATADDIRNAFPDGLTAIFAIGATRRTYIIEHNRGAADPGYIHDPDDRRDNLQVKYQNLIRMYFELGGQNLIIGATSYRSFFERGPDYAAQQTRDLYALIGQDFRDFYTANQIDPYFVGLDSLLSLPATSDQHALAVTLQDFQKGWVYGADHYKLIWEIASIPLYTLLNLPEDVRHDLQNRLVGTSDLNFMSEMLYAEISRHVFGTSIARPRIYLGTCMSGDIKYRGAMPLSLTSGEYFRAYYTPYPTLFITRETLAHILADAAFSKRFATTKLDYSGQLTPEQAAQEYERIMTLSQDPTSILGLTRSIES